MDSGKPPADDNRGPMLLATVYSLHALTILVYLIRLCSRLRPKFALTAADYTITVSVFAKCASVGLTTAAILSGFGRHAIYLDRSDLSRLGNYLFFVFIASVIATSFARISIACLLLQITLRRAWRVVIWLTIVTQGVFMAVYIVAQLAQCQSAISKKIAIQQTQCLTPPQVVSFSYASMGISLIGDLICAIIPCLLIRKLTRSPVEKALTFVLLASCLLASGLGIAKIYYTATFDFSSSDGFYLMVDKFFWSRMEESMIVIAACAPLLKGPIERGLKRFGFAGFVAPTRELNEVSITSSNKRDTEWGVDGQQSVEGSGAETDSGKSSR